MILVLKLDTFCIKNSCANSCTCFLQPLGRLCQRIFCSFSSWRSPNPQRAAKSGIFSRTPRPMQLTSDGRLTRCELAMLAGSARVAATGLSRANTAMVVQSNANTRIPAMIDTTTKTFLRPLPGGRRESRPETQSEHQYASTLTFCLSILTS